jgi:hypothetical protein
LNCGYDPSTSTLIAMLTQVNALPGTQIKSAISNRDGNAATQETIFYVGGHVVIALIVVPIVRGLFRHKLIEMTFEILAHCRVGIFINCQRRRGVLDEKVQQPAIY